MKNIFIGLAFALSLASTQAGVALAQTTMTTNNTRAFEYIADDITPSACEVDSGLDFGPDSPTGSFAMEVGSVGSKSCDSFSITRSNTGTSLNFVFGGLRYVTSPQPFLTQDGYDGYIVLGGVVRGSNFIQAVPGGESICILRHDLRGAMCRMAHAPTDPWTGEPLDPEWELAEGGLREVHEATYSY